MDTYLIKEESWQWTGFDTGLTTGEHLSFQNGALAHATSRNRMSMVLSNTHLSRMIFDVNANSNTADGANLQLRGTDTDFDNPFNLNQLLTLDQADGVFQDTTNEDTITTQIAVNVLYTQGNNTVNLKGGGILARS